MKAVLEMKLGKKEKGRGEEAQENSAKGTRGSETNSRSFLIFQFQFIRESKVDYKVTYFLPSLPWCRPSKELFS